MAECATRDGLKKAEAKLRRFSSKAAFADVVELSRSTVQKFFAGKGIRGDNFRKICAELELDWQEIAGLAVSETVETAPVDAAEIDALVQKARRRGRQDIQKRCGQMRVLDMTQPIELGAIYTDVNILEKVAGKTRREIADLMRECGAAEFERAFLGNVRERRVDGLKTVAAQKQLMILGRPGAGKTTFMKRMATLCNQGAFLGELVPVFVSLKEFAETINQPGLLNFIAGYFVSDSDSTNLEMAQVKRILQQGRGLVLLDGLDEVLEKDNDRVLREIREFARDYDRSHIIITCRIAAREYVFEQFTEVEMANFSDVQIQAFADKWFKAKEPDEVDEAGDSTIARLFWQALEEQEPIKELAANPLLLTLLCLEFEESSEFPQSRAELYERGLNVLLSKWDGKRRIKREEIYKRLSTKRKEIMLGRLAMHTFEKGEYFFPAHVAAEQIGDYIQNLPDASADPDVLLVDSKAVLKAIESHHGLLTERARDIYSFSHLTFHEYFVAKYVLEVSASDVQNTMLQQLVKHVTELRWREVFLLVSERIENADYLLAAMLKNINLILAKDKDIQQFLIWSKQKADSVDVSYKPTAVRAFYIYIAHRIHLKSPLDPDLNKDLSYRLARDLDSTLDDALVGNDDLARSLDFDLNLSFNIYTDGNNARSLVRLYALALNTNLYKARSLSLSTTFQQALLSLRLDLESATANEASFREWKQMQKKGWMENLKSLVIRHRNIGHLWQFSTEQTNKLSLYYVANLLLVECMKRAYVSNEVRQQIEDGMLMPDFDYAQPSVAGKILSEPESVNQG